MSIVLLLQMMGGWDRWGGGSCFLVGCGWGGGGGGYHLAVFVFLILLHFVLSRSQSLCLGD